MHKTRLIWVVITVFCLDWLPKDVSAQATTIGVGELKWSPNGQLLALASWDSNVYVLDASGALQHTLSGHSRQAVSLSWSPSSEFLATSGSDERFINVWRASTGELLRQVPASSDALYEGAFNLAWSSDGAYLLGTSFDTFEFWETATWTALEPSRGGTLYDAEWSPDGSLLAVTDPYTLSFFNGQTLLTDDLNDDVIEIVGENPEQLSWSPDSELLATTDRLDPRVSIWHIPTRTRIGVLNTFDALFEEVTFIANDQLAVITETGTLYVLDTAAAVLATVETGVAEVRSLAWNPQHQIFAVGGAYTDINENGITGLPIMTLDDVLPPTPTPTTRTFPTNMLTPTPINTAPATPSATFISTATWHPG